MKRFITQFLSDESGATAIEYGLLAALIAVVIIAGASTLGGNINTLFNKNRHVHLDAVGHLLHRPATG